MTVTVTVTELASRMRSSLSEDAADRLCAQREQEHSHCRAMTQRQPFDTCSRKWRCKLEDEDSERLKKNPTRVLVMRSNQIQSNPKRARFASSSAQLSSAHAGVAACTCGA